MIRTIEATIDESGHIGLLGPINIKGIRRAFVTVLDEPPNGAPETDTLETTLLSEQSLSSDWERPEENDEHLDDFQDVGARTPSRAFPKIDGLLVDRVNLDAHTDTSIDPVQETLDELKAERAALRRESEKMLASESDS
uniref:Uncharacterized protein n=1 Tax=Candidatus Kentrum sp. DK TaxID=2126562 RepID=A0A450TS92_9GAMM|nr:MAG: hypothetical protein BECKDK2373B_GA0170837_13213 [Candidatus Kentron sp. DK]